MSEDVRPDDGVDPVTGAASPPAPNREPAFVVPGRAEAATAKLEAFATRTGRRPNVLVILMDDVGWGDFGCYGGGVAVGAPTPNIDRLAREGLLLTSCYSEPSCTPTRASIMTGRLPDAARPADTADVRHARGAAGRGHAARSCSPKRGTSPRRSASGTWARTGEPAAARRLRRLLRLLSVSDMYTEWRDPYFFPEVVYSEARTDWVKNIPFNKCFVHATARRRARGGRGGHHPGALPARRQVVRLLGARSSSRWPGRPTPGSCTTAPAVRTSTTTPIPTSWAARRRGTPTRTPSSSSTTSAAGWSRRSSAPASSSRRW